MELTKGMKKDIQAIISQMTNDELDVVQTEILRIKNQRKRDELKQTVSEVNALLTKLSVLIGDTISVDSWVNELDNRAYAEIHLLDLIDSLKELTY
jgi:hypothetical protein